jgi:pimeloyl-ACP methyl ester carboxylesterase
MPKIIEQGKVRIPSGKAGLLDIDIYFETYSSTSESPTATISKKPTFLFLHGGPGILCHKMYVPFWAQLADVANINVEFIDLRGHGESGGHGEEYQDTWCLEQWADDVVAYCKARAIEKPILGCFSLGTWIGYSYLTRYPQHASKILFVNGEPWVNVPLRSEKYRSRAIQNALSHGKSVEEAEKYGEHVKHIVLDLELIAIGHKKSAPDTDTARMYVEHCMPLFSNTPYKSEELSSCTKPNIPLWQYFDNNEYYKFDFRPQLDSLKLHLDTLQTAGEHIPDIIMIAGEYDPEHPIEGAIEATSLLGNHAICIVIKNTGDPIYRDQSSLSLAVLKTCIQGDPFMPVNTCAFLARSLENISADEQLLTIYATPRAEAKVNFIWEKYACYNLSSRSEVEEKTEFKYPKPK